VESELKNIILVLSENKNFKYIVHYVRQIINVF